MNKRSKMPALRSSVGLGMNFCNRIDIGSITRSVPFRVFARIAIIVTICSVFVLSIGSYVELPGIFWFAFGQIVMGVTMPWYSAPIFQPEKRHE